MSDYNTPQRFQNQNGEQLNNNKIRIICNPIKYFQNKKMHIIFFIVVNAKINHF